MILAVLIALACVLTALLGLDVYFSVRHTRDVLSGEPVTTARIDLADLAIVLFAWTLVLATWRTLP